MLVDYFLRLSLERSALRLTREHDQGDKGHAAEDSSIHDREMGVTNQSSALASSRRRSGKIVSDMGSGKFFSWSHDHDNECHNASMIQSKEAMLRYKRGVIAFVEVSVLTHSVPIGLALGLQSGSAFTGLFIAVMFHQLIEGFGVGAATIEAEYRRSIELLLALAFALTTPIGIAIGIILQMTLNTESHGYIITVGTCNSVGAGLLLYIGIEHLNALRTRGGWLRQQSWTAQFVGIGSFVVGGVAMFVICKYS